MLLYRGVGFLKCRVILGHLPSLYQEIPAGLLILLIIPASDDYWGKVVSTLLRV